MTDRANPNLPTRAIPATVEFYGRLGFAVAWQDSGWLILERGEVTLEFFPYPDLDPKQSSFGACLRLDNADQFYDACKAAGIPEDELSIPRIQPLRMQHFGLRLGHLLDPDGSLLTIIQNAEA